MLAYDFKTGQANLGSDHRGRETRRVGSSAPIAWDGLVFVGNAGGDFRVVRAHVRARREDRQDRLGVLSGAQSRGRRRPRTAGATPLDMSTWQNAPGIPISGGGTWTSYTPRYEDRAAASPAAIRPRLRNRRARGRESLYRLGHRARRQDRDYKHHFKIVPKDWHDWDVSNPPVLIQTMGGKQLMVVAPKDGHLYGFDLATNAASDCVVTRRRGCRRDFLAWQGRPFLSGQRGARNGTARPTFRRPTSSSWARSSGATR